jgi:hypothetical protein
MRPFGHAQPAWLHPRGAHAASQRAAGTAELEEAIAAATPGSSELQYAPGFLRRLDHWESEAKGQRTYYVEGFGLIGEADLGRFIPNFSQFITMAGEEQWQDMQIGDTFEGTAFDKPVRLTRRS